MQSIWRDPSIKDDRVSIAILQPSGVTEKQGDVCVPVVHEHTLLLIVSWPVLFMGTAKLMNMWIQDAEKPQISDYHSAQTRI